MHHHQSFENGGSAKSPRSIPSGGVDLVQKQNRGSVYRRESDHDLQIERQAEDFGIDQERLKKPGPEGIHGGKRETGDWLVRLAWRKPEKVQCRKGEPD